MVLVLSVENDLGPDMRVVFFQERHIVFWRVRLSTCFQENVCAIRKLLGTHSATTKYLVGKMIF